VLKVAFTKVDHGSALPIEGFIKPDNKAPGCGNATRPLYNNDDERGCRLRSL
jgi:hypothetical protein